MTDKSIEGIFDAADRRISHEGKIGEERSFHNQQLRFLDLHETILARLRS